MNPQAEELNQIIQGKNQVIYDLLSEKGKNIFFPKKGILGQTAQAKGKKINATIGAAIEDDGTPMRLYSLERLVDLPSTNVFPYAPSYGRPDIREQWRELIYKKNPSLAGKEISLPVVTNALTHALSMTAYLFLNEGESILVSDLFWGNYNLIFGRGYNATIDKFSLFDGEDFNIKSFREKMMEPGREKIFLILNFPN